MGGSPPRAWGILDNSLPVRQNQRFTPTCVGNTQRSWEEETGPIGSPPRAWGIPLLSKLFGLGGRFTPTCVGNTIQRFQDLRRRAVHPHVRGEYDQLALQSRLCIGSPPRAWGIQSTTCSYSRLLRFTPTCVGNTKGVIFAEV